MQPFGSNSLVSSVKKSRSFDSIWELSALKPEQSNTWAACCYCQAVQTVFSRALPLVPLTKNEAFLYEYEESRHVPSKEWNLCNVDRCPPMLCKTSNFSKHMIRNKSNTQRGFDFAYMEEKEVGQRSRMLPATFSPEENIHNPEADIPEYTLGRDYEEIKSVEITGKLYHDLLLRSQELEEENRRLLSHDVYLEKRMSEISEELFMWESNYSKYYRAASKLEIELQNIEQDIESKDERIEKLNHTIEALWLTADELADSKVVDVKDSATSFRRRELWTSIVSLIDRGIELYKFVYTLHVEHLMKTSPSKTSLPL